MAVAYRELPVKVLGVGWLGLMSDKPETRQFYAEVLGLNLTEDQPTYSYFIINETTHLEVLSPDTHLTLRQHKGSPTLGFLVEDLESAVRELRVAGVSLKSEIEEWRSDNEIHRWIYFEDPEGHTLVLLERYHNLTDR